MQFVRMRVLGPFAPVQMKVKFEGFQFYPKHVFLAHTMHAEHDISFFFAPNFIFTFFLGKVHRNCAKSAKKSANRNFAFDSLALNLTWELHRGEASPKLVSDFS